MLVRTVRGAVQQVRLQVRKYVLVYRTVNCQQVRAQRVSTNGAQQADTGTVPVL